MHEGDSPFSVSIAAIQENVVLQHTETSITVTQNAEASSSTTCSERERATSCTALKRENQKGVVKVEYAARIWSRKKLFIAYVTVAVLTSITALQGATVGGLTTYVTAQLGHSSMVTTINTIASIMYTVAKPPIGKLADVVGRVEGMLLSILCYVLGLLLMALCKDVATYGFAQVFYVIGSTGVAMLIQIFFGDTTSLINRALFIILPNLPYLWTWVAGPSLAGALIDRDPDNWRWGYGMFCILIPVSFAPLGIILLHNQHEAKKLMKDESSGFHGTKNLSSGLSFWKKAWAKMNDFDVIGLTLLTGGLTCWLLPFTVAGSDANEWKSPSNIIMVILGPILLILCCWWCLSYATQPIIPIRLLKNRTLGGACFAGALYFMAFYLWDNYFYQFMIVAKNMSYERTGRISQTFDFSSTLAALIAGLMIKWTGRCKFLMLLGAPLYVLGQVLMIFFRTPSSPVSLIIFAQVIVGIGAGIFNYPAQAAVQAGAGRQEIASAITCYLTALPLGGAIGSSVAGAIWNSLLPRYLASELPEMSADDRNAIFNDYTVALAYSWGSAERDGIVDAYGAVLRILCVCGAVVSTFMLVGVCLCENVKFHDEKVDDRDKTMMFEDFSTNSSLGVSEVEGCDNATE